MAVLQRILQRPGHEPDSPATNLINRMLHTTRRFFAAFIVGALCLQTATAQDDSAEGASAAGASPVAPAGTTDEVAEEGDGTPFDAEAEQTEFRAAVDQWRQTLADMQEAALRFHNGTAEGEQQYRSRYRELADRGREEFDRAVRSATRLLQHPGGVFPELLSQATGFLASAVRYRYDRDWFELTGEAAEALLSNGIDDPLLKEIAGVSLAATNRFERAAPLLEQVIAAGTQEPKVYAAMEAAKIYALNWEREQQLRQSERTKDDLPRVLISTTRGDILVELFEDQAPNTVANFIRLVEDGFYDDLLFHQVIEWQIAMTGDSAGDGSGNAGYRIADEAGRSDARDPYRGSLVMAKLPDPSGGPGSTLPDTASSQFFFTFLPMPNLKQHTVFGRIIDGFDSLAALTRINPTKKKEEGEPTPVPDRILSAEVVRKRPHEYQPEILEGPPAASFPQSAGPSVP